MSSCPIYEEIVDFRNFTYIVATIITTPLKETKGWLQ